MSSSAILQSDVKDIKGYIAGNTVSRIVQIPSLSSVDDEVFKASLSAALMRNAEMFQPWTTIGVDVWIEAGRWWLLRVSVFEPHVYHPLSLCQDTAMLLCGKIPSFRV